MSTTLQPMNAIILRSTQIEVSRRLDMMCEADLVLNDHVFNDRHTFHHDMYLSIYNHLFFTQK